MRTRITFGIAVLLLLSASAFGATWKKTAHKVRVSAYCLGPCKRCGTSGRTATGLASRSGKYRTAATHWRVYPKGARIRLTDGRELVVQDAAGPGVPRTGIDVLCRSHAEAKKRGVSWQKVSWQKPKQKSRRDETPHIH